MSNEIDFTCPVEVGFQFEKEIELTKEEITTFAKLSGDMNPLHYDVEAARASRFGGIIASGPQSSALFMGTIATYLAPGYTMLGMKIDGEFLAPVYPDLDLRIRWIVTRVTPKAKLNGYIATAEGGIHHKDEQLFSGIGTCLIVKE